MQTLHQTRHAGPSIPIPTLTYTLCHNPFNCSSFQVTIATPAALFPGPPLPLLLIREIASEASRYTEYVTSTNSLSLQLVPVASTLLRNVYTPSDREASLASLSIPAPFVICWPASRFASILNDLQLVANHRKNVNIAATSKVAVPNLARNL